MSAKRILVPALALLLILSIFSCADKKQESDSGKQAGSRAVEIEKTGSVDNSAAGTADGAMEKHAADEHPAAEAASAGETPIKPLKKEKWMLDAPLEPGAAEGNCSMCSKSLTGTEKTNCRISFEKGDTPVELCCPHCAVMFAIKMADVQKRDSRVVWTFTHDTGEGVNMMNSQIVLGSDVRTCCLPSVLVFSDADAAAEFHASHGGELMNWGGAIKLPHSKLAKPGRGK